MSASWFGGNLTSSLGSLKSQVTSSLKEVFEEDEPADVGAQLMVAKERIDALSKLVEDQKVEIEKMKERNHEMSEQKQAVEMQKEVQCNQFREMLQEKEDEILTMSQSFVPDMSDEAVMTTTKTKTKKNNNSTAKEAGEEDFSSKVVELERRLREERESHQNEMVALQEAFSNREQQHSKQPLQSKTSDELLQEWRGCSDHEELESLFLKALRLVDEEKQQKKDDDDAQKTTSSKQFVTGLQAKIVELEKHLQRQAEEKASYAERYEQARREAERFPEVLAETVEKKDSALSQLTQQLAKVGERMTEQSKAVEDLTLLCNSLKVENQILRQKQVDVDANDELKILRSELDEKEAMLQVLAREKQELEQGLTDECGRSSQLASEFEMLENLVMEMKSEKQKWREGTQELEAALAAKVTHAETLQKALELSEDLNRTLEEGLRTMTDKSTEHADSIKDLQSQINHLQSTDSQTEFKRLWQEESQKELTRLKDSLEDKNSDVEKMRSETSVYKQQYEALLQEYNQYLEDLESLQSKAENLERLEEEVQLLRSNAKKDKTSYDSLNQKLEEASAREQKRDQVLQSLEENLANLESTLFKERNRNRELQGELDEKDCLIEDMQQKQQQQTRRKNAAKESLSSEEKELDESVLLQEKTKSQSLESTTTLVHEKEELSARVRSLESDLRVTREELTDRLAQLEQQDSLVLSLQDEVSSYKAEVEDEVSRFEEQTEQLRSIQAELGRYKDEVSDSGAKFQEHSLQLSSLQEELDRCMEQWASEHEEFVARGEQLENMEAEMERSRTAEEKCRELTLEVDSLKSAAAAPAAVAVAPGADDDASLLRVKEQEAAIQNLSQELDQMKWNVSAVTAEKVELQREVARVGQDNKGSADWQIEKNQMLDVLNEKTRESGQLKLENSRLLQSLGEQKIREQSQQEDQEGMTKETVVKLSQLIREKDLEIGALRDRNDGLVQLVSRSEQLGERKKDNHVGEEEKEVEEESNLREQVTVLRKEKQELYESLTQKHQESLSYYAEIQKLTESNRRAQVQEAEKFDSESQKLFSPAAKSAGVLNEKSVIDNSNEIIVLKARIKELERKINIDKYCAVKNDATNHRKRFLSESLEEKMEMKKVSEDHSSSRVAEGRIQELTQSVQTKSGIILEKEREVLETHKSLQEKEEELARSQEELRGLKRKLESLDLHQADNLRRIDELKFESENVLVENRKLTDENQGLISANNRLKVSLDEKEHDLEMAKRNLQQLTEMLDEKSQNTESVQQERLHNLAAIQELQSAVGTLKRERDEIVLRLSERERELAETRREINNVIDKKRRLELELERLREHLLAVEEGYTQEAILTEERERELRRKLQVTEESLRVSTAHLSTSSQEATVQLGSLQRQVKQLSEQRDQLLDKLGKVIQEHKSQETALDNLTMVLEGFQREKENHLKLAEKDYLERLQLERNRQSDLEEEMRQLQEKVEHANQGLAAATRLSEQLDKKAQVIGTLKQEIKLREELLKRAQSELGSVANNNAGKVDKYLVKNLVVGYVSADAGKKPEVLKIVATVLDFNQEERQKTGLEGASNLSWLGGWLGSQQQNRHRKTSSSELERATGLDQSLTQAFIKFLENESAPKVEVKLPVTAMAEETTKRAMEEMNNSVSSTRSSVNSTPTKTETMAAATLPSDSTATVAVLGRQSPNPLLAFSNAHALPTFSVNRSSSSILKHVLQEERPSSEQQPNP